MKEIITIKPANVRIAVRADEDSIYDLLCSLYKENATFSMNERKVRNTIKKATQCDGGIIGLIEKDGKIVGIFGSLISQFWYTDDYYLDELWNFVHPDYRKSSYSRDLIDFAKWASEALDIPLLMGIMSTKRTEAKMGMYDRKLKMIGAFYVHNFKSAGGPLALESENG